MSTPTKVLMGSGATGIEYFYYHFADTDISSTISSVADSSGNHYTHANDSGTGTTVIKTNKAGAVQASRRQEKTSSTYPQTIRLNSDESKLIIAPDGPHQYMFNTSDMSLHNATSVTTTNYWGGGMMTHPIFAGRNGSEWAFVLTKSYSSQVSTSTAHSQLNKINISDGSLSYRRMPIVSTSDKYTSPPTGNCLAKDDDGYLYLYQNSNANQSLIIYKFNPNSSIGVEWAIQMFASHGGGNFYSYNRYTMDADGSGNTYFCYSNGTLHIEKFNSSGSSQWKKTYTGGGMNNDMAYDSNQRNCVAVGDVFIVAAKPVSGNGCQLLAVNQSDGSVAWYLDVADSNTGASSDEYIGLCADPSGEAFTVCQGRLMIQLPVDGSITGTFGNLSISSRTNPSTSNISSNFSSYGTNGITTNQTQGSSTLNHSTRTISNPSKTDL